MAILIMIPHGNPDLTAYLNELLRTNKPEQQNNTFWFPNLKILESLRITPQYKQESSKNGMKSRTRNNSINKRAQNLETNFSSVLIGLTHFLQKRRNKQLKLFWLIINTFLPDREWILGRTRSSR